MNVNTGKIKPLNLVKQSSCKRHITAADIENPDRHTQVQTLDPLTEHANKTVDTMAMAELLVTGNQCFIKTRFVGLGNGRAHGAKPSIYRDSSRLLNQRSAPEM